MPNNENIIVDEAAHASKTIVREIRTLLRALGPKDTKRRKILQAKLRLLTDGRKPLDMLAFAQQKVKEAAQFRNDAPTRAKLVRYGRQRWRSRMRPPLAAGGVILDTRKDAAGTHLYFECSNGQAIEASRITGVRGVPPTVAVDVLLKKHNHAQRRRFLKPLGNPVLVGIARRAIAANAERKA